MAKAYTLATYKVLRDKEAEFLDAWNDLAATFSSLERAPYWGVLIRSTDDPMLFHSFGPWDHPDDVLAMRKDPDADAAFQRIAATCSEMTAGNYEQVKHVKVRDEPTQ